MATQIHQPTEPGIPLRVVFVPSSHYTATGGPGLSDFNRRVDIMWRSFRDHVFFKRYLGRIAVWRVDKTTTKDLNLDPALRDVFGNEAEVLKHVQSEVPSFDAANDDVVVFCMAVQQAGNVRANHRSAMQPMNRVNMAFGGESSLIHEFGHAWADLEDEYSPQFTPPAAPPHYANIALQAYPGYTCQDKWGDMIGLPIHAHPDVPAMAGFVHPGDKVGCDLIIGNRKSNWYRPVENNRCIMFHGGSEFSFCPVCQRHLEKMIHGYGTGETRVRFDRLPDGHPITAATELRGNEFLALGVAFEPAAPLYAKHLKTTPAVIPGPPTTSDNCLAMVEEGNPKQHVSRNLRMRFDWPLEEVDVVFHGADSLYQLEAFDVLGTPLATATQQASLGGGPHTVTVKDPRGRIRTVDFGERISLTLITELRYR